MRRSPCMIVPGAPSEPDPATASMPAESTLTEDELQRLADAYDVDVTAFFGGRVTPVQYLFGV